MKSLVRLTLFSLVANINGLTLKGRPRFHKNINNMDYLGQIGLKSVLNNTQAELLDIEEPIMKLNLSQVIPSLVHVTTYGSYNLKPENIPVIIRSPLVFSGRLAIHDLLAPREIER